MASRTQSAKDDTAILSAPDSYVTTTSGGGGGGSSYESSFSGITNPEALAILMDFIRKTASGGTDEQRRQRAERNAEITRARGLMGDYTKQAAFADAADLMAQNLRQSLEKNMPAINRSIEGAGTSAASMAGLLSTKLATETAQGAGALGAEQAKSYGNISAAVQGVLELLTRIDPSVEGNLIKALELTRTQSAARSSHTNPTNPTTTVTPIDQGTYAQDLTADDSVWNNSLSTQYVPAGSSGMGSGYIVNNDRGSGTYWNGGQGQDFQLAGYDSGNNYYSPEYSDETSSDDLYSYFGV